MAPLSADSPYYDLGRFHRPITTTSPDCQIWFDRGLVWTYAFNHEEAARCFQTAVDHDSSCPMAYWGLAYASGPNYNKPWELFDKLDLEQSLQRTFKAAKAAKEHIQAGSPGEKALVEAVQFRYQDNTPSKDYARWHREYAAAMEKVYQQFGDDLDVAALYADSMMNLTPWQMWDLKTGEPCRGARTIESKQVLDIALKSPRAWQHPGLLHSYVHLIEMSPWPELAMNAADHLRTLVPEAGHLCHMPSHLDLLVGDYRAAMAANAVAITADEKYATIQGNENFYTLYRLHDYHSLIYAAMFAGKSAVAFDAVDRMEASIPEHVLRITSPPMADWTETLYTVRAHVMIRFGRWEDIIALPLPKDQHLYCVTTASFHYAKAIAHAAKGRISHATTEQTLFERAATLVPKSRMDFPNKCVDILAVARAMLNGELEYRRGNYEVAFQHLQTAVDLDDNLIYSEPWAWILPTRHAYAALLLEQDHIDKAAALYRADLGLDRTLPRARQHPNNVWALHGYHECLTKMGKTAEAELLYPQLKMALATADVDVTSSCFCRVTAQPNTTNGCCANKERMSRKIQIQ